MYSYIDFLEQDQMTKEWIAWQQVWAQLGRLGLDVDQLACDPLVRAIRLWGEELVALRAGLRAGVTELDLIRTKARTRYMSNWIDD